MSGPDIPFEHPPAFGRTLEVAPGILWLRLPLPFRLDHVNAYLLEDQDGWTVVDTGVGDETTRRIWVDLLAGLLGGRPVRRILVTHFHPDHVGAAAFLCERTAAPLAMGEIEYLTARAHLRRDETDIRAEAAFYRAQGLGAEQLTAMAGRTARYRAGVPDLPRTYEPIRDGDTLVIGGRRFEARCFAGHSPAQVVLHAPADDLFIAADHVLAGISPNVSVAEERPADDPLGLYLASLAKIRDTVPDSVLVLPGHRLPFRGLHGRTIELTAHHAERCAAIVAACRARPLSVAEILPHLFAMTLDAHQLWFAFSEALAHVNHLERQGRLICEARHGVKTWAVP